MRHLVSHHDFNLVFGETVEQRVSENDALGCTQPGKSGVGFLGLVAHRHPVNTQYFCADALGEHNEFLFERFVIERLQFIEQR